jgi:hypothetical protein
MTPEHILECISWDEFLQRIGTKGYELKVTREAIWKNQVLSTKNGREGIVCLIDSSLSSETLTETASFINAAIKSDNVSVIVYDAEGTFMESKLTPYHFCTKERAAELMALVEPHERIIERIFC